YGRLRKDVGGARAARIAKRIVRGEIKWTVVWVVRIAFDLRRTAFVAPHEDRCRYTEKRHRRRIKQRFPRHVFFRLRDERNDLFRRLKNATAHSRERERCAHQLDERATLERIIPTFRLLRKLTRNEFTKL